MSKFLFDKISASQLPPFDGTYLTNVGYRDYSKQNGWEKRKLTTVLHWLKPVELSPLIEEQVKDKWISVDDRLPELEDNSVIGYFENGSIETIHICDWFADITDGVNEEGKQMFTKWYLTANPTITHWKNLPSSPKTK